MTAILTTTTPSAADVVRVRELFAQLDPVVLAVALVQYAERREAADTLLVALALAVEAANLRRPSLLDDYIGGRYHRQHPLPEFTELQRRRYPPTGSRELWIKYGPDGPPVPIVRGVA